MGYHNGASSVSSSQKWRGYGKLTYGATTKKKQKGKSADPLFNILIHDAASLVAI
jgi:hypothetical protein